MTSLYLLSKTIKQPNGCLEWQGTKNKQGYGLVATRYGDGRITKKPHNYKVHRVMWEIHHGKIPDGLVVCHHCDNPSCINIDHLFLGTLIDNYQDCYNKGRTWHQKRNINPAVSCNTLLNGVGLPSRPLPLCYG
jgi:hypothetical protein